MNILQEKIQNYLSSDKGDKFSVDFPIDKKISIQELMNYSLTIDKQEIKFGHISILRFKEKLEVIFNQLFEHIEYDEVAEKAYTNLMKDNVLIDGFLTLVKDKDIETQHKIYSKINTIPTMEAVAKRNNLDPWMILNLDGYEVFWPSYVLSNQLISFNKINVKLKWSKDEKFDYFLDNLDKWKNRSGHHTSYQEMNARSILPLLVSRKQSDLNSFFKSTGLLSKEIDKNTKIFYEGKLIGTFHSRCMERGNFLFLNKFLSQKSLTPLEDCISVRVAKGEMITTKKSFFKELKNIDFTFSEEIFKKCLNKVYKKVDKKYSESSYNEKCYFPFSAHVVNNWENLTSESIKNSNIISDSKNNLINLSEILIEKYPDVFKKDFEFLCNSVIAMSKIDDGRLFFFWMKRENEKNHIYEAVESLTVEQKEILYKKIVENLDKIFNSSAMSRYGSLMNARLAIDIPIHDILINLISDIRLSSEDAAPVEKVYENFKRADTRHYLEMQKQLLGCKLNNTFKKETLKSKTKI